jgi:spore coat polysaccharide biosynthesis protein SpsF
MSFDIIIQARYTSTRLPGKILLNFSNESFLSFFIKNLKKTKLVRKIILACPKDEYVEFFNFFCKKLKISFFSLEGNENDLLNRYFYCAKKFSSKNIIRITSDCPFINPLVILQMIKFYKKNRLQFLTNNKPRFIPHGFDCEIFSFSLLRKSFLSADRKYDREHVTPWMYNNIFKKKNYIQIFNKDYSKLRLTLDTIKDYVYFTNNDKILKNIASKKKMNLFLNKL